MPEMSNAFIPEHKGEKEPREKILKLGKKITDCLPHKLHGLTTDDPEYWGLACVVTDEMADIALKMKVRKHYTFGQLLKMNKGYTSTELQKILDEMSHIGILEYDYGDLYDRNGPIEGKRERRYLLPLFVPGSAEFTNMIKEQLDEHPELAMFFERMTFLPLEKVTPMVPPGGAGIGMHVIPVEQAIDAKNTSLDIEHISYWLKKYEGHLSVGICSCRYGRSKLNEGCGDSCEEWCIGVGDMADYCVETNKGRKITYEEAIQILKNAEANGYVHQITNIDGENKIFAICNCNVNICNALRTSQLFNTPNMSRSAYTAHIDIDKCVACGKCVEYCPSGAVKLGQKLNTKNGPIKYPKHELPDHMPWGKDKWDEDYRDKNRINCYQTGTAPCKVACPAHIAVEGYIKMVKEGRFRDALALIKKDNPFPAICGRVCNKRCEAACTRGKIDEAVAIDDIKKFVAELDLQSNTRYIPDIVIPSNMGRWKEKIAIIGAGPAGLSCAYYLATKGYYPVVFEKNEKPGGMLTYGIPSYKLEKDVIDAEIEILKELGVNIKCGVEVGKDVTIASLREEGFKAFYIAIGCQGGKLPGIPGEDAKGTSVAVKFLHDATVDKSTILNGNVVVVGGGNVAIDCARTAKRFKANKVSVFSLEDRNHMPATNQEILETLDEGIEINNGYGPKEIIKDENGCVKQIVFKKCLSVNDPVTHKFNPVYDENDTVTIDATHVIFAIGQTINWGNLLEGTKVTFQHGNYPVADKLTYQTNEPDIFVGGDVYTEPKFAIDAIEAGKCAAESLHRFVQPGTSLTIGRNRRDFIELNKDDLVIDGYDNQGRNEPGMDETIDYRNSFKDAHKTFTKEQAMSEANRCLCCGASIVDENKCIGCGVCTTKCEFDAIHLVRDHPEMSTMVKSEDKFKKILPYAIKRGLKIKFKTKTPEEKLSIKKHKEYVKAQKGNKK
ncbi:MAG TPA: pyridine nucleotide-disulfide oxidoreductase [Acholeplasmatales bacterium]|nr:pyridine nucleotide-disulfide oxidoreductase [Acholeplasmatales bacterium]